MGVREPVGRRVARPRRAPGGAGEPARVGAVRGLLVRPVRSRGDPRPRARAVLRPGGGRRPPAAGPLQPLSGAGDERDAARPADPGGRARPSGTPRRLPAPRARSTASFRARSSGGTERTGRAASSSPPPRSWRASKSSITSRAGADAAPPRPGARAPRRAARAPRARRSRRTAAPSTVASTDDEAVLELVGPGSRFRAAASRAGPPPRGPRRAPLRLASAGRSARPRSPGGRRRCRRCGGRTRSRAQSSTPTPFHASSTASPERCRCRTASRQHTA